LLILLVYGAAAALAIDPTLAQDLSALTPSFRLPVVGVRVRL
jgi:hypothetical protein